MSAGTEGAPFRHEDFRRVWDSLSDEVREDIKAKARWEHMTLGAVMRDWWPELWAQVQGDSQAAPHA